MVELGYWRLYLFVEVGFLINIGILRFYLTFILSLDIAQGLLRAAGNIG